jgi:hypothetical protein
VDEYRFPGTKLLGFSVHRGSQSGRLAYGP